jgi:hypothetical protein
MRTHTNAALAGVIICSTPHRSASDNNANSPAIAPAYSFGYKVLDERRWARNLRKAYLLLHKGKEAASEFQKIAGSSQV